MTDLNPEEGLRFLVKVSNPDDAPMAVWAVEEIDKLRGWVTDRDERIATLEDELAEAQAAVEPEHRGSDR